MEIAEFQRLMETLYGAGDRERGIPSTVAWLAGLKHIRETIAFPMNQTAEDLMMDAPREVADAQLEELSIKLDLIEE